MWHVMHQHLKVFMSLKLILFLMATFGYWIPVVAHTYVMISRTLKRVGSSQRESPNFEWVMVHELRLLLLGLMF